MSWFRTSVDRVVRDGDGVSVQREIEGWVRIDAGERRSFTPGDLSALWSAVPADVRTKAEACGARLPTGAAGAARACLVAPGMINEWTDTVDRVLPLPRRVPELREAPVTLAELAELRADGWTVLYIGRAPDGRAYDTLLERPCDE